IEQSLMPAETGKRSEHQTAVEAGDRLSTLFHDYDWADEVLHAQIVRRWIRREGITTEQAAEQAAAIHQRTWAALDQYKPLDPQTEWWDDFVRRVLGKPSALKPEERGAVADLLALLESDPSARFVLDGQTVLVEDALAVRPDWASRLEAAVRRGQLEVGPWYVLADELIPSGESLLRNLLLGARDARRLG